MFKKKFILIITILLLIAFLIFLISILISKYNQKNKFEEEVLSFANKNDKVIFEINKIVMFSNCDSVNKLGSASNFTIENLYQYTDIAIYINNLSEEKTLENTFKKVKVNNIKFNKMPSIGEPKLYFKSINNFAKSDIIEENLITNSFEFNITSEDTANLDLPVLYNNLANPITLSYINTNIKTDYTFTDTQIPITYDGSLLKRCNIPLNLLACNFSFDIYITNNLDEEFKSTVFIDVPLSTSTNSIYEGKLQMNKFTNFIFYRYK